MQVQPPTPTSMPGYETTTGAPLSGGARRKSASAERSFTVEKSDLGAKAVGGRYMSQSAYAAASKAARILMRDHKASKVKFTLRETTRGGKGKEYTYVGTKEKLSKPKIIKRGSTEIKISHIYKVKSVK